MINIVFLKIVLYNYCISHFCEPMIIERIWRALHVIQALNGNKCYAYFVSGKIKELKKKKKKILARSILISVALTLK